MIQGLQRENERVKKVQSQIIVKDKYYRQIEENIEHDKEYIQKALEWAKSIIAKENKIEDRNDLEK